MNYELAKELKDAGFPQEREDACQHELNGLHVPSRIYTKDVCEYVMLPTLSELIAACEDFHILEQFLDCWEARALNDGAGKGTTPEEAVARLWLALHAPEGGEGITH